MSFRFVGFLLLLLSTNASAQTLQPTYGAPSAAVSVCNGNATFKIKIIGSSVPCGQGTIDILLPTGYVYVSNSASVSAGSGTVTQLTAGTTTAQLRVNAIPASPDSTVISYQAYADCGAIGTATNTNSQARYTLTSPCMGSFIVTSNTFNTQSAALSFSTITNQNYNGAVGDTYNRELSITNNGLGDISSITLIDTTGNGLSIMGASTNPNLALNSGFGGRCANWNAAGCSNPEIAAGSCTGAAVYTEVTYGGTNSSNIVAEIDQNSCIGQQIRVVPGRTYQIQFRASRRTSGSAPATTGITVAATGSISNTQFFTQNYTYTNTTFGFVTQTATFTVPASATDQYVDLTFRHYNTNSTHGTILDDVTFSEVTAWTMTTTKTVSGTDTIHTYVLTGPALSQGQSVRVTQNVKIVSKCNLQSKFSAYFGCNGNMCTTNNVFASATGGATVNSSLAPVLRIITTGITNLICRGESQTQIIGFANTGNAPLEKLDMNIFSSAWSAAPNTQYFNPARTSANGAQTGYSNFRFRVGANGVWAPLSLTYSTSFTSPGSAITGMPSNVGILIPVINPGDTLFISVDERNSPLPGVSPTNTIEQSGIMLRYSYDEGCASVPMTPVAVFLRAYRHLRINSEASLPANMEQGSSYDFSYNFTEFGNDLYRQTGTGGSSVKFNLVLPPKIIFSGSVSDISLVRNGATVGVPTNYVYNTITNTVSVTFPVTAGLLANIQGARLGFNGFTLNCAASSNDNRVILYIASKGRESCASEDQILVSTGQIGFVCPQACGPNGGISFNGFTFKRVNYGLPDNDNNGVADATGSLDFSKIRTDYAMVGDTLEAAFHGRIQDPGLISGGFRYGYAVDTFSSNSANIVSLYATVQLFASGSTTPFYTCNNVPVTGGTSNTRRVDFSISALNSIGSCPLPVGYTRYNDGDSVVVKIFYRLINDPGPALIPINIANKLLISNMVNPSLANQYACGAKYSGNFSFVGIGGGGGANYTYTIAGDAIAATQVSNVTYFGPCCVSAGRKPFAFEYRPTVIYDSMAYVLPPGFDFVSATVAYAYTTGPSSSASIVAAVNPVDPTASTLVFNIRELFENGTFPYGDQGSNLIPTVRIRANCDAPEKSRVTFYVRRIPVPGSGIPLSVYMPTLHDSVYYTAAHLTGTPVNNTVATNSATVSWDVQISNATTVTAKNAWLAKDSGPGGVTITSVQRITGPGGTVTGVIAPSTGNIFQLGNLGNVSNYYRINAAYTDCLKDSMRLAYWFDCSNQGYPTDVTTRPERQTIPLYVIPQQAALQLGIISQPDPNVNQNFCDELEYTLEVYNAGPGSIAAGRVNAIIPSGGGLNFRPGSYYLEFPLGSGSYVNLHDSLVTVGATEITFRVSEATIPTLNATQGYRIRFALEADCNFASGQTVRFSPSGRTPCGQMTTGITQQSEKIQMVGVPETTNLYGITSSADTAVQACVTTDDITSLYRFKIVNQGPLPTSVSDIYAIVLPTPWELDTTNITFLYNNSGAAYWRHSANVYYFRTGVGLAVGDSVVMTATLRVHAPQAASVPLGSTPLITENAIVLYSGYCVATGQPCPSSQVIVSSNQTTAIPVASPAYSISSFTIQQNTSRDANIIGSLTINHTNTLYAPHHVMVNIYKDVNNNGVRDVGDSLMGQQSFPVLNRLSQTFRYSINSPYDANLCPSLIAEANFGCYSTTTVLSCASTTAMYSNGGTTKRIEHCDDDLFNLAAADAAGKWVVDSGTVAITNPLAASTTATVAIGSAAKLIWLAYATDTTRNILVHPDTIRLISNARPVIVKLADTTLCQGSPLTITASATVLNATPSYQWSKNGVNISGATSASLLISSSIQPADAGKYLLTVTGNGCVSRDSLIVTVNNLPTAAISYQGSPYCSVGTAAVTQTGQTGGTYTAPAGLSIDATTGAVDLANSTPGTYTVTYQFTDGCSNTTTGSITINQQPALIVNDPAAVCAPATVNLTAAAITAGSTAGLTYTYFTNATGTTALASPAAVTTSGTYYIRGTINGCSDLQPVNVTIAAVPVATISYAGGPFCRTGTATVDQTGQPGGAYSSSAGLAIDAATGAIDLAASTVGVYTVTYSFSNGACASSVTTNVTIVEPILTVTDPAAVCAPGTVDITSSGNIAGLNYSYYTDPAGTVVLSNPSAVGTAGTYYVRGVDANGCPTAVVPVNVTINAQPALSLSADKTLVCKWEPVVLTATSPGSTIVWEGSTTADHYTVYPPTNTTYRAEATDASGCKRSEQISIAVRNFVGSLTASPATVISGTTTTITASANSGFSAIAWLPTPFFADQQATTQTIPMTDTSKTIYAVLQSTDGCRDTASVRVEVSDNTKELFVPNAFSPNNDGRNDVFRVYGTSVQSVEIKIFNQWGQLIADVKDNNKGWDGTFKGQQQPVGIYIYAIRIKLFNGGVIHRNGSLSLVR